MYDIGFQNLSRVLMANSPVKILVLVGEGVLEIEAAVGESKLFKVGKRRFARIVFWDDCSSLSAS